MVKIIILLMIMMLMSCAFKGDKQVVEISECVKYQPKKSDVGTLVQECLDRSKVYQCRRANPFWQEDGIIAICDTKEECNQICSKLGN